MRKVGSLHGCVGCTSKCVARSGVLRETSVAKLNFDLPMNFTGKELARNPLRYTRICQVLTWKTKKMERASPCNYAFASAGRR